MKPLITIKTIPIKVELVEKEPLKLSAVNATEMSVDQQQDTQSIRSKPIRIPIQDYFESSSTYNWDHPTYTAAAKYDEDGNLKLNVKMEDGESKAIRFEQSNRGIDSIVGLLPATTGDENYAASNMEISFNMQDLPSGMPEGSSMNTQFYPPDLELVVTQRPEVIITYVGGPIYVPPSADPNYQPVPGLEDRHDIGEGQKFDQTV